MEDDTFSFNVNFKDQPATRQGILSIIASLYDPLGFVAPFVLLGKCILQEMCHRGKGWDEPLSEDVNSWLEEWKGGLQKLREVKSTPDYSTELLVGDPEVRAVQVNVATTNTSDPNNILSSLSQFSSWLRLLKVVARIKRR